MLAEYSSRMLLKNRIVIGTLTTDRIYEVGRYVAVARYALGALAREAERAAERIAGERQAVAYVDGDAMHVHDYHAADVANLEHREAVSRALAVRLDERCDDEEYLAGLVERARDDAWLEISRAIESTLDRANIPVDATYQRERSQRLRLLVNEDLAALWTAPRT